MSDSPRKLLRWRRPAVQVELPLTDPADEDAPGPTAAPLRWWQLPRAVAALAAVAVLMLVLAVAGHLGVRRERAAAQQLANRLALATLRAPTAQRSLRIRPNPRSWSATPDARIDRPEPPEMIELFLPVGYARYSNFALTIDKADQGRMMVLERVAPDSNGDLRVALNSSAFGPGEYRLRLQGYTWRGQRVDAGWVRLIIE